MLTIAKGVKFTFINLVDAFIQSDLQLNIFTHIQIWLISSPNRTDCSKIGDTNVSGVWDTEHDTCLFDNCFISNLDYVDDFFFRLEFFSKALLKPSV